MADEGTVIPIEEHTDGPKQTVTIEVPGGGRLFTALVVFGVAVGFMLSLQLNTARELRSLKTQEQISQMQATEARETDLMEEVRFLRTRLEGLEGLEQKPRTEQVAAK